ncbi:MAG: hypothetical protein ACFFE4_02740 [Candidatus Thorarchaeota archaeon]
MNRSKIWLDILATVNLIIFFTLLIYSISTGGGLFFPTSRYYYFLIFFASLLIYFRRLVQATALQIVGCFFQGCFFLIQMGIGMEFSNQNFWESLTNSPFNMLEFLSFIGNSIIAGGLLIYEYHRYNAKKYQKIIL